MIIAVDMLPFAQPQSGIQVYIKSILDMLQTIDAENHYYLFEYRPSNYVITNTRWKIITGWLPKFWGSRTVWMHCVLPMLLHKYHSDVLWSPEFIAPLFNSKRIPVVLMIYDLTYIRYPATMVGFHLLLHRLLVKRSIKKAKVIIADSFFTKKELIACIPQAADKRITVAACGKPAWSLPNDYRASVRENFLFFAGNFEPRKNLINVIRALELLQRQGLTIPLQLAGLPGWRNREIHDYISRSPIGKNIYHLGYISEEQLIYKYCTCKALIFPSFYEGFGMPVLEALTLDCLVVTSSGTVMQEICGRAALYFDPGDFGDIAGVIASLYQTGFDRNMYLRHRGEVLARYGWKDSAETILEELIKCAL